MMVAGGGVAVVGGGNFTVVDEKAIFLLVHTSISEVSPRCNWVKHCTKSQFYINQPCVQMYKRS